MNTILSVIIPVYDDVEEAVAMVRCARQSCVEMCLEFFLVDLRANSRQDMENLQDEDVHWLTAPSLPAAKNRGTHKSSGEFLLFLCPGLFPKAGALQTLVQHLRNNSQIGAVGGRWSNANLKIEVGYNIRRFPTLISLLIDILLLNKLFPRNRFTRSYKMRDFDHRSQTFAEHANDCAFMVRRELVLKHGGFNEIYAPGWFDQVEFCQQLYMASQQILFEPTAEFISNANVPLINRLVRDNYERYRSAECHYIRRHFGFWAARITNLAVAIGMLERFAFSLALPRPARKWFLSSLGAYVSDSYIRRLRAEYWQVFRKSLWSNL